MAIKVEDSDPVVPVIFNMNTVYGKKGYGYLPQHLFKAWLAKGIVSNPLNTIKDIAEDEKPVKKVKKSKVKKEVSDEVDTEGQSDGDRPVDQEPVFVPIGERED